MSHESESESKKGQWKRVRVHVALSWLEHERKHEHEHELVHACVRVRVWECVREKEIKWEWQWCVSTQPEKRERERERNVRGPFFLGLNNMLHKIFPNLKKKRLKNIFGVNKLWQPWTLFVARSLTLKGPTRDRISLKVKKINLPSNLRYIIG